MYFHGMLYKAHLWLQISTKKIDMNENDDKQEWFEY